MPNPRHKDLDTVDLHKPFRISDADPGAIGDGRGWFSRLTKILKIRNAADDDWDDIVKGALILLEEQVASSSASLNFTNWYNAAYEEYVIELINILPATDLVALWMRMSTDGGATYDSGANYAWSAGVTRAGSMGPTGAESGATKIQVGYDTNASNIAAHGGFTGTLRLYDPASTAHYKRVLGQTVNFNSFPAHLQSMVHGVYLSTTAVDAFQFLISSGNIVSGTIRVYGIAK
jgi:hypothetical protein